MADQGQHPDGLARWLDATTRQLCRLAP